MISLSKFIFLILLLVVAPHIVTAQEQNPEAEQLIQEVFQTELVYPQAKGEVQITFGTTMSRNSTSRTFRSPGDENDLYVTRGFVYQPASNWEFGFGVPVGAIKSADNIRAIFQLVREF